MSVIPIGAHILHEDRQLLRDGQRVSVGPRALAILSELARHRGEVVTKDELLSSVWPDVTVEENALQVHVAALRKALGRDGALIETIRGVGYELREGQDEGGGSRVEGAPGVAEGADPVRKGLPRFLWPTLGAVVLAGLVWLALSPFQSASGGPTAHLTVIPIEAAGDSPRDAALAAGINDEIVVRLRRIEGLAIASARDGEDTFDRILSGTMRTDGDAMRLTARLEDKSGNVVWSDVFERDIDDLFMVQEEIARAVAGALSVPLDVGTETRNHGGTDDPEAYANYVQGRANRQNPDRSVPTNYLERALSLDPDYVKALTEMTYVDGISLYWTPSETDHEQLKARMDSASAHAMRIAPDIWQAQAARGWYHLLQKDFVAADKGHRKVLEMDPGNDPELRNTLANFHRQLGRMTKATRFRQSKSAIDPIFDADGSPGDHLYKSDYAKVIEMYENRGGGFSVDGSAYNLRTQYWALRLSGRSAEAKALANSEIGNQPGFEHYAAMDYTAEFPNLPFPQLAAFAERKLGASGRPILAERAHHASQLGNHRLAMDYLRLAYDEREGMGYYQSLWHPALAPTRQTPQFARWIVALGMDDAWRESGDWGDFCTPVNDTEITCK